MCWGLKMEAKLATFQTSLREKGYKLTLQRMAIFEAMHNGTKHPTAEDVYNEVSKSFPMIGLSTVYNTLETLCDLGMVDKLNLNSTGARYDFTSEPHAHLVCLGCGKIVDDSSLHCALCRNKAEQESGFKLLRHSATFYGYCGKCLNENPEINL